MGEVADSGVAKSRRRAVRENGYSLEATPVPLHCRITLVSNRRVNDKAWGTPKENRSCQEA